jgi:protein arginine N-methyltransferase 3
MLEYCKEKYNFDFLTTRQHLNLDFHGAVKLCNFGMFILLCLVRPYTFVLTRAHLVRRRVRDGLAVPDCISGEDLAGDDLLLPVIKDDALIILLDDVLEDGHLPSPTSEPTALALMERKNQLENDLARVTEQFANYRLAVEETLDRRWGDDALTTLPNKEADRPSSPAEDFQYWESYAGNGEARPDLESHVLQLTRSRYPRDHAEGRSAHRCVSRLRLRQ